MSSQHGSVVREAKVYPTLLSSQHCRMGTVGRNVSSGDAAALPPGTPAAAAAPSLKKGFLTAPVVKAPARDDVGEFLDTTAPRVYQQQVVCVGCLFLRTPSRAPYRTPPACANRAAYPDPPPVVPDPESIDAQASYRCRHSTIARCVLSPARIVSRHWGPPRACHRVPCCE
jgi:hypothetical protein